MQCTLSGNPPERGRVQRDVAGLSLELLMPEMAP